ncbi:MAG: glycosyltransferase family 4 protein [Planctomycetota bacterium]|nr:glycosyltransferase family 4 protein [Planctomycetota bacterium]
MRIVQLTPGAGGMFCGACMRDNALVAALRKLGHDVTLIPLYTPLTLDEPGNSEDRVFFGGVNVFLQQKSALFRHTPGWLDKPLDNPRLLREAARLAVKTRPEDLGELTISVLRGEEGRQLKELEKLTAWLTAQPKPDIVCLSNALLSGLARRLRAALKAPIVCTLQGEDFFVDGLPEPQRKQAWALLRERAADIDAFIAVSRYYGEVMRERLMLPAEKTHVVHNGIDLSGYGPARSRPAHPTVGYLARLAPEKGLHTLVEAFGHLHRRGKAPGVRLRIAGSQTDGDKPFVAELRRGLKRDGLAPHVDILPNLDRAQKIGFLQSLSVFSVPAVYGESFGLYVLEALVCGVPVVQPRHAAFPELIEATGGGVLCEPGDVWDLAAKLEELLLDEPRRAALGAAGRDKVIEHFSIERAARGVEQVLRTQV